MLVLYRQEMNSENENIDDDVQGEEQAALVEAESKESLAHLRHLHLEFQHHLHRLHLEFL